MAELNITTIPAPRVPFIDERTGLMAREWYRFFLNMFVLTGSGSNATTLDELQLGPPPQQDSGGGVTSVSGTAPVVSSGGTTPVISMAAATTSVNGYLTSTDWNTFNSKGVGSVTSVSVVSANGLAGTVATATTTPAVTLSTTVTGVLKGNGTAISAATSGTDYAPATSGTSILYGSGAGGFSNVTIGTGVAFAGGTLSATGSGGTVTSVTGTAPVVSSGGATPAISMAAATTSVNGYLTSTDWTTFNNKVTSVSGTAGQITSTGGTTPVIDLVSGIATAGTTGSASLIPVVTIDTYGRVTTITTAANPQGTVTSVTGTAPVVSSGGATPAISMAAATTSVNGYLTSTDWTTFNNKGSGTVTSVAALTLGTTGTDLSSTVANGTTTPVITLQVPTASATNRGALSAADWTTFNNKGSGSVTSVAQSFTGGLISVSGSPITTSGTLALTVAGTSGGVPYFSSASTWATSAALAAGAIVLGGGAGVTPATTATGTGVVTALGVNTGSAGAVVLFNGALGTPTSGTVTNLTGTASININGTVGATTPAAGAFTTLSATGITTVAAGSAALPAIVSTTGTADTGLWFPAADTVAASTAGTERMRIVASGNVGIGTTSPGNKLSVAGSVSLPSGNLLGFTGDTAVTTANYMLYADGTNTIVNTPSGGNIALRVNNATQVYLNSSGNVGIGTTGPNYKLEISTDSAGKPGVGGLWTVVSDERIKSDIVPANLDRCYEIVKSVPLKYFGFAPGVYTDDQIQDKHNLGWIAQDVQKVFKNAVSVKPFTLKTDIPDGAEEYEEQDFTLEAVEKTETSIQVINGKAVQVSKVVTSENKVMLFDTVDVLDEAGAVVMDGDKPLTYQMPRMITKTRPKVRHDVIEDCLDLNSGQMIAALYGCVQALMAKVEALEEKITNYA